MWRKSEFETNHHHPWFKRIKEREKEMKRFSGVKVVVLLRRRRSSL